MALGMAALLAAAPMASAGAATPGPEPASMAKGGSAPALRHVSGRITDGLLLAMRRAGVPEAVADQALTAFALSPDVPVRPSEVTRFTLVYDPAGRALHAASVTARGHEYQIYRYALGAAQTAYLGADGAGVARTTLGRPIAPSAYVSSPYGWRIHPVLGVPKFHNGIDYAAPPGTPVRATADGVIDDLGERGNYGRYIRISHDVHLSTAYAHLRAYAAHLKVGGVVKRGQVIGYVGASGLATGPHLYYEVLIDHRQVDPARVPLITPIALDDVERPAFESYVRASRPERAR